MKCGRNHCKEEAAYYYIWPGSVPLYACEHHAQQAQDLGRFMGFELLLVPVSCVPLVVGPQCDSETPAIQAHALNPATESRSNEDLRLDEIGRATGLDVQLFE